MLIHRRCLVVLLAAVLAPLALSAGAATASCALDPRPIEAHVEAAEVVFKGHVTAVADDRRTARFAVDEVWRGQVAAEVVVHGGPEQPLGGGNVATSVDRHWEPGATYLVFPRPDDDAYRDDACSATTEWEPGLADARPDDWSRPLAVQPADGTDLPIGLLVVTGVVVVVVGWAVATRGRGDRRAR